MKTQNIPSKQNGLVKFLLVATVFIGYALYLNYHFGFYTGGATALITWSFFVLCTPIADAGFLLDFPLRVLLGIPMLTSEIFVWIAAGLINIIALNHAPQTYNTTTLTHLFHKILVTPYPYWGLIVLSAIGTFLSVILGDELFNFYAAKGKYSDKHKFYRRLLVMIFILAISIFGYYELAESLAITALN